jgi:hydroxypyruvate reductase
VANRLRDDALAVVARGVSAADPELLTRRAARNLIAAGSIGPPSHVIAVGKAALAMWRAVRDDVPPDAHAVSVVPRGAMASDGEGPRILAAGHPLPTSESLRASEAAMELARGVGPSGLLWLLVSGGTSALLAAPAPGLTLEDKIAVTRALLGCGADIASINVVRKHLSAVKGGRLARAAGGRCVTLALSDVIGPAEDDPSIIGSGPGVPDPSTFRDALAVIDRFDLRRSLPATVIAHLERATTEPTLESPKPADADMRAVQAWIVGGRRDAMQGARLEAEARGYTPVIVDEPVLGEARDAARSFVQLALRACGAGRRCCIIASGETTVTVRGPGRGGRNQEFALAAARELRTWDRQVVVCSAGTDGIDGPTDAAGGIVDRDTCRRAIESGVSIDAALDDNDAYHGLERLGGLIRTGPTGTNVGDLMVLVTARV